MVAFAIAAIDETESTKAEKKEQAALIDEIQDKEKQEHKRCCCSILGIINDSDDDRIDVSQVIHYYMRFSSKENNVIFLCSQSSVI